MKSDESIKVQSSNIAKEKIQKTKATIEGIVKAGAIARERIDLEKELILKHLSNHFAEQREDEDVHDDQRNRMLSKLSVAAAEGNLEEMRRIKKELYDLNQ